MIAGMTSPAAAQAAKKGEKPAEDAETKPPAEDDEPEPEPTKADHARFRAERRKLRAAA